MEELETPTEVKTNLRDKRVADVTVGDAIKIAVLVPVVTIGAKIASNVVTDKVSSVTAKLRRKFSKKSEPTDSVAKKAK